MACHFALSDEECVPDARSARRLVRSWAGVFVFLAHLLCLLGQSSSRDKNVQLLLTIALNLWELHHEVECDFPGSLWVFVADNYYI